ncbi:MAG: ATP-binding protein [Planctomycetota bacterium]
MNSEVQHVADPKTVMFAMGDETVAHAFSRILEAEGHVTLVVDSVGDAEGFGGYDVLVAEIGDGAEVCGLDLVEHLRELGLDFDAVLVANDPTREDYQRAIRLGVLEVLERPVRPDDLIRAIESSTQSPLRPVAADVPTALNLVLDAQDGAAETVAREIIGWCARCEVTPAPRARIASAAAEIVQNSVDHGARTVDVLAHVRERSVDVEVADDGPGFDVVSSWTDGRVDASGGLGRAQALSDDLVVHSSREEGTCVRMRFGITALDFDAEDQVDLSDLDYFTPATSKELLATLADEPDAPIVLSPALAVVVGRLLVGPDPRRVLQSALWS